MWNEWAYLKLMISPLEMAIQRVNRQCYWQFQIKHNSPVPLAIPNLKKLSRAYNPSQLTYLNSLVKLASPMELKSPVTMARPVPHVKG